MCRIFPHNAQITFPQNVSDEDLWQKQVISLWQTGFTSWRHNLAQLSQESKSTLLIISIPFHSLHLPRSC